MESALAQLAAFSATGITIKAATTSTAIQHFIRLRTDLSRAPETVVVAEPFRRALSEIWVEFDPNGGNAAGFILLIAAARRLEPLSTVESGIMVAALQRIIDLTITARSATPATSTNILPAPVTASRSRGSTTTSTRPTRPTRSSLLSLSSIDSNSISSDPALSAKRSASGNSVSPRSSKRPRTNQELIQDLDELNRNSTNQRYFDANSPPIGAMIATAILSTIDKRATQEQILGYFTQNYSMNQIASSWSKRILDCLKVRPYFQSLVDSEETYWEIIEGEFEGPFEFKSGGRRKQAQMISDLPPIVISIPLNVESRSWVDLITEAILSTPGQRMSTKQIAEYLVEKHDHIRAQEVKRVRASVSGCLGKTKSGFRKGDIATERIGKVQATYYFHIKEFKKVASEKVEIGNEEKEEDRIEMEEEESSEAEEEEEEKPVKLELEGVKEEVKMEELVKVEIKEELDEDKKYIVKIKTEEPM